MKFTKEQLIEKSKPYFENNEIDKIKCTSDGNFFYTPEGDTDALNHKKSIDRCEIYTIEREDIKKEVEEVEPIKEVEVKEEIKEVKEVVSKPRNKRKKN